MFEHRIRRTAVVNLAVVAISVWSCGTITSPDHPADKFFTLGQEFTLEIGQVARTMDSSPIVGFTAVPEESRCPPDVVCVWEGFARMSLAVGTSSGNRGSLLSTNPTVCCTSDTVDQYIVRLIALNPVPRTDEDNPAYVATLLITDEQP